MMKSKKKESNTLKKESNSLTHNVLDLGVFTKEIITLLGQNPTTNYVIKKTGKSKKLVGVYLNRLIKRGIIKRIDRGVYKVLDFSRALPPSLTHTVGVVSRLRLHNLQIELPISRENFRHVRNVVLKNQQYYNVRNCINGFYFDLDVTGLVTADKLFVYFPKNWSIEGGSLRDVVSQLYDVVKLTLKKWESKFRIMIFKDGKVWFNIRNMHIAFVRNGITDEVVKRLDHLVIYDDVDGKARLIIDMSKGFKEFEAVHSSKAFVDTQNFEDASKSIADGEYKRVVSDVSDLKVVVRDFVHGMKDSVLDNAKVSRDTSINLKCLVDVLKAVLLPGEKEVIKDKIKEDKSIPDYIN